MPCDFIYKSWYKRSGKTFYVCSLNDPIVCILSQPVWMESLSLYLPEEEDKESGLYREFNFTVEITADREANIRGKDKGWHMVANYTDRDQTRKGDVDILFEEPTVVNAFRVTGTRIVNPKTPKDKDFAVEIRI